MVGNKRMVISLVGPSNISQMAASLGITEATARSYAERVGKAIVAVAKRTGQRFDLLLDPDKGMALEVARVVKRDRPARKYVHVKMVGIIFGYPWPHRHTFRVLREADWIEWAWNWLGANRRLVTKPKVVIVLGLSGGTAGEIGYYLGYNIAFGRGNVRLLICIRELLRDGTLPAEIVTRIPVEMIVYVPADDMGRVLEEFIVRGSP